MKKIKANNKKFMVSNLKEAKEELERIICELEKPKCNEIELWISFGHLYHHINFAWNIRKIDNEKNRIGECSMEDFNEWQKFPKDIEPLLDVNTDLDGNLPE